MSITQGKREISHDVIELRLCSKISYLGDMVAVTQRQLKHRNNNTKQKQNKNESLMLSSFHTI